MVAHAPPDGNTAGSSAGTSPLPSGYTPTDHMPESGKAPGLQTKVVSGGNGQPRTWALVFGKGDEVMSGLADWAEQEGVSGARLQGIGAFSSALLAWFDKERRAYRNIPVDGMVECVSLLGDVGLVEDKPVLHVHACVGHEDGTARGGHLLQASVFPTLEVFVTETEAPLHKHRDAETTLELFQLER